MSLERVRRRGGALPRAAGLPVGQPDRRGGRRPPHPDGVVDLSVGTPVDPVPDGRPAGPARRVGLPGLPADLRHPGAARGRRRALRAPARRRGPRPGRGAADDRLQGAGGLAADAARPRARRRRRFPELAYPTYEVGALLAGASRSGSPTTSRCPTATRLVWLNSPSNPTGRVLDGRGAGRRASPRRGRSARSSRPTSATSPCPGRGVVGRPCWTPSCTAAPSRACSRSTRCRRRRTSRATAPGSCSATPCSSPACSRCASTPG